MLFTAMQAAIASLGAAGKVSDMDLDEVETTDKKAKKKDKKKRTAAELEANIGMMAALLYADYSSLHRGVCPAALRSLVQYTY